MAVKLILTQHVEHLGERGAVVSVAPGYARNFLLPKGLACEMTPGNLKRLEHQRKAWAARDAQEVSQAAALGEHLAGLDLSVARKAGETGTLYGSVTNADVAALLLARGVEIDRRQILIGEPIKTLGEYEIPVKLHPKVRASVRLRVQAEGSAP
jgi:large subunit ribosomal protein L9